MQMPHDSAPKHHLKFQKVRKVVSCAAELNMCKRFGNNIIFSPCEDK
jgi:hypothetical protein